MATRKSFLASISRKESVFAASTVVADAMKILTALAVKLSESVSVATTVPDLFISSLVQMVTLVLPVATMPSPTPPTIFCLPPCCSLS